MHNSKILYHKGLLRNWKMLTQSQYSQIKFVAKLENIKGFFGSLKAINFDETGTFQISDSGVRVIVENSKFVQASVYVTKECFSEYHVPPDETIQFYVNLNVVTECLGIFSGVECSMKMIYKGAGCPLVLVLEHHGEDDVVTECSIKTKNHDEPLDYSLDEDGPSYNAIIIRGPDLANIFNEIDRTAEELEFLLSPKEPFFRITTIGVIQSETQVEVAKTSDMITTFRCKETTSMRYKMSHIKLAFKALLLSSKVAIRTDSSGLLGLQLIIQSDDEAQIYIEFFITPLVNYD